MAVQKRPQKPEPPADPERNDPERVSLNPLDPETALRGLLATPAPDQKPAKRDKRKRKPSDH